MRREGLAWLLIIDWRHLAVVLREFIEHFNAARPHRAVDLRPLLARERPAHVTGEVVRQDRLGGLIDEVARRVAPALPTE